MKCLARWSAWVLALVMLTTLTGCGQKPNKTSKPSVPVIRYALNTSSSLLTLPLQIALKLHFFEDEHIQVKRVPPLHADLAISESRPEWPVIGCVASRPDLVIASPVPDPHFRLRALNRLSVVYAANLNSSLSLVRGVMNLNRTHPSFSSIPFRRLATLWAQHRLPWAVVSLKQFFTLRRKDPQAVILNWLGASTGPIPVVTISGQSPHSVQFLRALNLALWYLHTSSPHTITQVLAGNSSNPFLDQEIQTGIHFDLWPQTTLVSPQEYNRGRALYGLGNPEVWPPFFSGVNTQLSRQALSVQY